MPTLYSGPVLGPAPGYAHPARSASTSRPRPGARCGGGAPYAGFPAADGRTISHKAAVHVNPHTIAEEEARRSTGSCRPHGGACARGLPSAGYEPPIMGMRLTGRAP